MSEQTYLRSSYAAPQIAHAYGERVHLLDDPLALTWLSRLGARSTTQPEVGRLVRRLYEQLAWIVIAAELPRERVAVPTRMVASEPSAVYRGVAIDPRTPAVTVGIARAGTVPSQVFYEMLNEVLDPANVRQDHLFMSRAVDAEGRVTGSTWHDAKIGTDVDERVIVFPDPMGATGSSMIEAIRHYRTRLKGTPRKIVCVHLIVTPEYLKRVTSEQPDVVVYALRHDRGLSPDDALGALPGSDARERGLDSHQYIIPGAGGLGEILNNAWI
ncbi:MAG: uracil phosphoribosyltransferase [Deltaproteobacteria bacterium]|nr:uracil phosphoribosyltransferase [Deltaproteobacteria bacterium]